MNVAVDFCADEAGFAALVRSSKHPPEAVVIDLESSQRAADLIIRVRHIWEQTAGSGPSVRIIAFGPHVRRELLDAARSAGADEVLTRKQVFGDLRPFLERVSQPQDRDDAD